MVCSRKQRLLDEQISLQPMQSQTSRFVVHISGIPASISSILMELLWYLFPSPWETRKVRRIPVVPILVQVSSARTAMQHLATIAVATCRQHYETQFRVSRRSTHVVAFSLDVQFFGKHVDAVDERLFAGIIASVLRLGHWCGCWCRFIIVLRSVCEQFAPFTVHRLLEVKSFHVCLGCVLGRSTAGWRGSGSGARSRTRTRPWRGRSEAPWKRSGSIDRLCGRNSDWAVVLGVFTVCYLPLHLLSSYPHTANYSYSISTSVYFNDGLTARTT